MHELSLCRAVLDTVSEHAGGRPVARVSLQVGHLRQVVPEALTFAWEMLTAGTDHAGCNLDVDHVPAVIVCHACGSDTVLDWPVLVCGACAGHDVELVSGEEFLVVSIDVRAGAA